ncbi:MAG: hypothetical protein ACPF8V_12295 [Luteibaculum sp.]
MKTQDLIKLCLAAVLLFGSSLAFAGGDDKEESKFNFNQLRSEVEALVKPLALKAKAKEKMWVVFSIDEDRKLQLLDYSAELKPLGAELEAAINEKLIDAGSFYSDTPYTLWVKVRRL